MRNRIFRYIQDHSELFGKTDSLEAILLARQAFRKMGRQRLTWLIFRRGELQPFAVARHYADPRWNGLLEQEYDLCSNLYASFPGPIVPEPLSLTFMQGLAVTFERWFHGKSFSAELSRQGFLDPSPTALQRLVDEHLTLARKLIQTLDSQGQPANPRAMETELIGYYQALKARTAVLDRDDLLLLDAALSRLPRLSEAITVKERLVNLDLVPSNLLRSQADVRVVDWEYHRVSTLWFQEPLKFAYQYLFDLSRLGALGLSQDFQVAFRQYLGAENEPVTKIINGFLDSAGLPVQDPALLQLLWLSFILCEADLASSVATLWSGSLPSYLDQIRFLLDKPSLQNAQAVRALETQMAEKELAVQTLKAQLTDKDRAVQTLSAQLTEKDQVTQAFSRQLAEKEQQVQNITHSAQERASLLQNLLADKDHTIAALNKELLDIHFSTGWALLKVIWWWRLLFIPRSSRREKWARSLFRVIRRIFSSAPPPVEQVSRPPSLPSEIVAQKGQSPETSGELAGWTIEPRKQGESPKVGIVIVSHNASSAVRITLASLRQARTKTAALVVLVDNASEPSERLKIRSAFERHARETDLPWGYIQLERNLGFAGGNNVGVRRLLAEPEISHICLLNSDVIVTDDWLDRLLETQRDIVSATTNKATSEQCVPVDYTVALDECLDQATESIPLSVLQGINNFAGDWNNAWKDNWVKADLTFFCVLIAKPVLEQVGLLDETFFPGGYEDDDFCLRADRQGYKTYLARDVFIHHWGSASFGQLPYDYYQGRTALNKGYLESKHGIARPHRAERPFVS